MNYVSVTYYMLVSLTVVLYYVFPKKNRWIVLLFVSGCFYYLVISNLVQIVVFAGSILFSFLAGMVIETAREKNIAPNWIKVILLLGVLISAAPLFASKGGDLWTGSILRICKVNWIIPVGLSFYTMQIVAYLVDIYRGRIESQKNIFKYGLFISFFPLIIQGPISRYEQLGAQLFEGHSFDSRKFMRGIQLILWGFFLKYMLADKSSIFVNAVFDHYQDYAGIYIFVAAVLYSLQLYTDFLSCVTMSQGVAGLFGIELVDNFWHPYFSTSVKDFWRRWHISLSSWLRDYIYIPLGGNRKGTLRKYINLVITFAVSGLWHGGSWKYLFWGLLHAFYQIMGEVLKKPKDYLYERWALRKGEKSRRFIDRAITFFLVMLAWIVFRAESLKAGIKMIVSMFCCFNPWILFDGSLFRVGLSQEEFAVLIMSVFVLAFVSVLQERGVHIRKWFAGQNILIRWAIYLCGIWSIWIFGTYGYGFNAADFIYGGF